MLTSSLRSAGVTQSLVLTVIGQDRPGLVEALARTIASHDANWVESRMARLAGQFAGILRVTVLEERSAQLRTDLESLQARGLRVIVETSDEGPETETRPAFRLELVGNDRPGIIREVSQTLAKSGVNVDELHTECSSAPMAGGNLFKATAQLRLPLGLDVEELRSALEKIAIDLIVDIHLDELTP
jgi:glycine cleavage system regulatory protein